MKYTTLVAFDFEAAARLKNWDDLIPMIEVSVGYPLAYHFFSSRRSDHPRGAGSAKRPKYTRQWRISCCARKRLKPVSPIPYHASQSVLML